MTNSQPFYKLLLFGFVAGFFSTLTFHQLSLWVLWKAGVAPFGPYVMKAVPPLDIPAFLSLAFWGGVWGVLLALVLGGFRRQRYWVLSLFFGAVLPSLVAWLVVMPLKGLPPGGGWHLPLLATALLINSAWGLGSAALLRLLRSWPRTLLPI